MGFDLIQNVSSCHIDLSPMLYYSHIPTMIISLLVAVFVFVKNRSLISSVLLGMSVVFSLWLIADLVAWISVNSVVLMFAWSFFGMLYILLFLYCFYFLYIFVKEKDSSFVSKLIMLIVAIPAIVFAPTKYNVSSFNSSSCVILPETLYSNYLHLIGFIVFVSMIVFAIFNYRKESNLERRKKILLVSIGLFLFLAAFFTAEFLTEKLMDLKLVTDFSLEYYGLFGMTFFMGMLAYLIVQYKAFDIKLIGAQAIMVSLIILIASQFAFIQNPTNRILTGITLVLAIIFGLQLIKSVKKEIAQKEQLAVLNVELQRLDKAKNEFINIASHQLRTPITVIKGVISMIQDGTMNRLDEATKTKFYDGAKIKCQKLEDIINDILNSTSLTNKKFNVMDKSAEKIVIKDFFEKMIEGFKPETIGRGITLTLGALDESVPEITGQKRYLEEAFSNLITNAIKYTPSSKATDDIRQTRNEEEAKIVISNRRDGDFVIFSVKDNGIGIPADAIPTLFQKFVRAKNATEMYTDGTGLGLFIIKEIVEGHGGSVWVESELGKGSEFFLRLPIQQIGTVDVKKHIEAQADIAM